MAVKRKAPSRPGKGRPTNGRSTTEDTSNGKTKKNKRHHAKHIPLPRSGQPDAALVRDADDMIDQGADTSEEEDGQPHGKSNGVDASFLLRMDEKQIGRSRTETERIHRQEIAQQREENRGRRRKGQKALPEAEASASEAESTDMEGASIDSDEDLDEEVSDDEQSYDGELGSEEEAHHADRIKRAEKRQRLAEEAEEARQKRKKLPRRGQDGWSSGEEIESEADEEDAISGDEHATSSRSKLNDGKQNRAVYEPVGESDEEAAESLAEAEERRRRAAAAKAANRSTITTGARFGMRSPYEIFTQKKRSLRLQAAREQIARLSTEIINDPEVSLGLIRRLAVFCQDHVVSPEDRHLQAPVDETARASAILSLCAIFVDILPGYRIRELTVAEKQERVNQELARRREWEQGLVKVYGEYLETCEKISRRHDALFAITIKATCTLAVQATQFNFRTNLLRSLVACLSRKTWDAASDQAHEALVTVLQQDRQGDVSLEVVRLLNRMVKEVHFRVHAQVLDLLRHLRLRNELPQGKRANTTTVAADVSKDKNNDVYNKKLKSKDIRQGKGEHLSKREAKRRKEMKEIAEEMKEAEAEVDHEERERHQTETLKLLFVLYFSIIKAERANEALLIATMKGLTQFAHRISVDFFRDLLNVLRGHIRRSMGIMAIDAGMSNGASNTEVTAEEGVPRPLLALHCIVAVLELLNGQGEALNIDLSDVVTHLYAVLLPLSTDGGLERSSSTAPRPTKGGPVSASADGSAAQLLLRALHLALVTTSAHAIPRERLAAFMVRMCLCALHTPPATALALLQTAHALLRRQPELQSLLDNGEDRARNGHFDPTNDHLDGLRPLQAGSILWPLVILQQSCHDDVRARAEALLQET